jgi:hypothetical protein
MTQPASRAASGGNWASSRLISRAGATGNSRVTLPFATSSEGREVGAQSCRSAAIYQEEREDRLDPQHVLAERPLAT